jgi:uncharacterized protein (DUF2147 family)
MSKSSPKAAISIDPGSSAGKLSVPFSPQNPPNAMAMKQILAKAALILTAAAVPVNASAQAALEGHWKNPKGSVVVRVASCGDAYCGIVIEASDKAKATAKRGGTARLVGTRILSGMKPVGDGIFKGQAFDPKRNIRAPATVRLVGSSTLVVKGCLISGILCKEQRWTRIS